MSGQGRITERETEMKKREETQIAESLLSQTKVEAELKQFENFKIQLFSKSKSWI